MSVAPAVSGDGRFVAFMSTADDLVPHDTNGLPDIFVRDRAAATTTRLSLDEHGDEVTSRTFGLDDVGTPDISADGRFITWATNLPGLVASDSDQHSDVFVADRITGHVSKVSVAATGSSTDGDSYVPKISADGRYVVFASSADDIVQGDTNEHSDIFVYDRSLRTSARVSVASDDRQVDGDATEPAISADGNVIAFFSDAHDLDRSAWEDAPQLFTHDMSSGITSLITKATPESYPFQFIIGADASADGSRIVFSGVAYYGAGDAVQTYVYDVASGLTERVSVTPQGLPGDADSFRASISDDGRYVAFGSQASDLVAGDVNGARDFFVRDLAKGRTFLVSVSTEGTQQVSAFDAAFSAQDAPAINQDGSVVAFSSWATNLVPDDTNGVADVFVYQSFGFQCADSSSDEDGFLSRKLFTAERVIGSSHALGCSVAESGA